MEKYREYVECYITLMKMADDVKYSLEIKSENPKIYIPLADEKLLKSLERILKQLAVQCGFVLDKDGCQIPKGDWWFWGNYKWVGNYRVEVGKTENDIFYYADLMRIEKIERKG